MGTGDPLPDTDWFYELKDFRFRGERQQRAENGGLQGDPRFGKDRLCFSGFPCIPQRGHGFAVQDKCLQEILRFPGGIMDRQHCVAAREQILLCGDQGGYAALSVVGGQNVPDRSGGAGAVDQKHGGKDINLINQFNAVRFRF